MISGMFARILMVVAMLALVYGAYAAFTDNKPGMAMLLAFGAVAAAIPAFLDARK